MTASPDTQVGGATIGKAEVDCRCRWSEAQWGCFDRNAPAGILYNDICIKQPLDHWLQSAKICITMAETASSYALAKRKIPASRAAAATDGKSHSDNIQIARYYGPVSLLGPETVTSRSKTKSMEPHLGVVGMADFGGMGTNSSVSGDRRTQWEFRGERRTPRDGRTYRTMEWVYTADEQDDHGRHAMHTFSTAFAFQHRGHVPVFMRIEVEGELGNIFRRGIQSFSSHFGDKDRSILTEIKFNEDLAFGDNLKGAAKGLDGSMQQRYYKRLPVRPPESKPWESPPASAGEEGTSTAPAPEVVCYDATKEGAANRQELLEIFNRHQSETASTSTEPPSYTKVTQPNQGQSAVLPLVGLPNNAKKDTTADEYIIQSEKVDEEQIRLREVLENPTVMMIVRFVVMIIDFLHPALYRSMNYNRVAGALLALSILLWLCLGNSLFGK